MKTHFLPAIKITLFTMLLFGGLYPLFIVGVAKIIAPNSGNGETVQVDGRTVGFALIGQSFTAEKYFNSRPSAVNYNAAATGGSNKGPSNPDYLKEVEKRVNDFVSQNPGIKKADIPVDLVTASGGGLDPDISIQAAVIQIKRIAKIRNVPEDKIAQIIKNTTGNPLLGLFGPQKINVLKLNIELDRIHK